MIRLILIFCFITISTFGQDNCIYFEHYNSIRVNSETKISLCRIRDSIFLTKVHKNDSIRVDLSVKEYKLLEKKLKKINVFSILDVPNNFLDGCLTVSK